MKFQFFNNKKTSSTKNNAAEDLSCGVEEQQTETQNKMSETSILIVDDVQVNLFVAEELFSQYDMLTETAASGFGAIEKIEQGKTYDIIFMDHQMPEMDGIETTKRLRDAGYTRPIVALTANTFDQEDFFLQNGFDAFLLKPMDNQKLDEVLKNFIGDKKRTTADCGNTKSAEDNTKIIAGIFLTDAQNSANVIEKIMAKSPSFSESDWRHLNVSVHAMKTALAIIGEKQLSATALKLEEEICARNKDTVLADTPSFLEALKFVIEKTKSAIQTQSCDSKNEDKALLQEKLQKFSDACNIFDKRSAKAILGELSEKVWSEETYKMLDEIQRLLWDGDFEKTAALAKKFSDKQS